MQGRRHAAIRLQSHSKAKPQIAYEFDLPLKSRKALTCGTAAAESRGQKRKLKGPEFAREFAFLSRDYPPKSRKSPGRGIPALGGTRKRPHCTYAGPILILFHLLSGNKSAHYREWFLMTSRDSL